MAHPARMLFLLRSMFCLSHTLKRIRRFHASPLISNSSITIAFTTTTTSTSTSSSTTTSTTTTTTTATTTATKSCFYYVCGYGH